jgi:predicted ArsR family transcriptional regulator
MERLRRFFDGAAEAIGEGERDESPTPFSAETSDADILALLSRRPCTLHGVSAGLGLNVSEAAKRLQVLSQQGSVRSLRKNDAIFYEAVRTR